METPLSGGVFVLVQRTTLLLMVVKVHSLFMPTEANRVRYVSGLPLLSSPNAFATEIRIGS